MTSQPREKKSGFERNIFNFFLFKRLPPVRFEKAPDIPDWRNPTKADEFKTYIQSRLSSSFIRQEALDRYAVAPNGTIAEDIETLNKFLVTAYMKDDHEARYRQNQYFLFQWEFTLLALLATILASITVLLSGNPAWQSWATMLGYTTTVVGAFTTLFVNIYNRERPQRKWFEKRRISEQFRKHYFLYLMHMTPYDTVDHIFNLETMVDRIRKQNPDQFVPEPGAKPREQHSIRETEQLTELYREHRVDAQMKYYKERGDEYDYNSDVTFVLALVIPLLVTIIAGLNAITGTNSVIAAFIVILPSFAAAFLSFQRIYDWERQLQLYGKTYDSLDSARIYNRNVKDKRLILIDLVIRTENVLASEADQWGTPLSEAEQDLTAEQVLDSFLKKSGLDENDDMAKAVREHLKLKPTPKPPVVAPEPNAGNPAPDEPPAAG